ncbi:MAG: hypothetical protein LBV12_07130 [Puniceicoccales bacterium]|jgi:hypothetical protein|nr:hypothetical protein [Puniceicoccales bacterium]
MTTGAKPASKIATPAICVMRVGGVSVGRYRSRDSRNGFRALRFVTAGGSIDLIMPEEMAREMAYNVLGMASANSPESQPTTTTP